MLIRGCVLTHSNESISTPRRLDFFPSRGIEYIVTVMRKLKLVEFSLCMHQGKDLVSCRAHDIRYIANMVVLT